MNIGNAGQEGDSSVFKQSDIFQCLENGTLDISEPYNPPFTNVDLPFVMVGDEAFPLRSYLMRPYPGRGVKILPYKEKIYNYRLSRAPRIIENTFGVMVARWRIFHKPIEAKIENCEKYIKAAVVLHNYLRTEENEASSYIPKDFVDSHDNDGNLIPGALREIASSTSGVTELGRISSNNANSSVIASRDKIANFFLSSQGAVPWQHKTIS